MFALNYGLTQCLIFFNSNSDLMMKKREFNQDFRLNTNKTRFYKDNEKSLCDYASYNKM